MFLSWLLASAGRAELSAGLYFEGINLGSGSLEEEVVAEHTFDRKC